MIEGVVKKRSAVNEWMLVESKKRKITILGDAIKERIAMIPLAVIYSKRNSSEKKDILC